MSLPSIDIQFKLQQPLSHLHEATIPPTLRESLDRKEVLEPSVAHWHPGETRTFRYKYTGPQTPQDGTYYGPRSGTRGHCETLHLGPRFLRLMEQNEHLRLTENHDLSCVSVLQCAIPSFSA